MANTIPAFDLGAASMVEPMMKAFGEQFFSMSAFQETPDHAAWFGGEMLSFDPAGLSNPGGGREPENPMETWISLFPAAPMFGVKWAFWPMVSAWAEPMSAAMSAHTPATAPNAAPLSARAAKERDTLTIHGLVRHLEGKREPVSAPRDEASVVVPMPTRPKPAPQVASAAPAPAVSAPKAAVVKTPMSKPAEPKAATSEPVVKKAARKTAAPKAAAPKAAAPKPVPAKAARVAAKPASAKPAATKPAATKTTTAKTAPKTAPKASAKPKRGADGRPGGLFAKAPARADDLKKIRGVGEKLEMVLNDLGIYQYKQIAAFDAQDYAWLDGRLGAFKGRGVRDDWTAQAKTLLKK